MQIDYISIIQCLKIIVTTAIFFVWFVRYENIKKEFNEYNFPNWFRDLVGILKISFTIMLHSSTNDVVIIGTFGIFFLMIGAVYTHVRIKSSFRKYIASVAMLAMCGLILYFNIGISWI